MYGRRLRSSFIFFVSFITILFMFGIIMIYDNNHSLQQEDSSVKKNILDETRSEIRVQLERYNFSNSGVENLDDLLMERGGQPLRTMIVSSWRSGSTFLGDLFNAMPGNFYHYEPFYNYSIVQIKGPPQAENALRTIRSLMKCSYQNMEHYFETHRKKFYLFEYNTRLWEYCKENKKLCFDLDFMERFCKLFPFQSMKLVRFRLRLVREIMEDKHLDVKTIYMVRDPRAVMQSRLRSHKEFCRRGADCILPEYLCADMIGDYWAAAQLLREFPNRFTVLRFEELALDTRAVAEKLLHFTGRQMMPSIEEFLRAHTNGDPTVGKTFRDTETYRDTQSVPFRWKHTLEFKYVDEIQVLCKQAMDLWGYEMAHNETHMKSDQFNSLKEYFVTMG